MAHKWFYILVRVSFCLDSTFDGCHLVFETNLRLGSLCLIDLNPFITDLVFFVCVFFMFFYYFVLIFLLCHIFSSCMLHVSYHVCSVLSCCITYVCILMCLCCLAMGSWILGACALPLDSFPSYLFNIWIIIPILTHFSTLLWVWA